MTAILTPAPPRVRRRVGAALVLLTGLSWAYLLFLSARMGDMRSPFAMPMTTTWTAEEAGLMWTMWAVMMAGMMLPSAAPMISAYASTANADQPGRSGSTTLFIVGYLAIWSGFALAATGAQWVLHDAALVNAMGTSASARLGGALLLTSGLYQFTGVKGRCLRQCRTPFGFLLNEWRPGGRGAVVMGLHHGALCVGCCWALMALLFLLGAMNLWWVALVAAVILLEKVVPSDAFTRVLGTALIGWGIALAAGLGA